jgi:hypothetical protein
MIFGNYNSPMIAARIGTFAFRRSRSTEVASAGMTVTTGVDMITEAGGAAIVVVTMTTIMTAIMTETITGAETPRP